MIKKKKKKQKIIKREILKEISKINKSNKQNINKSQMIFKNNVE